MRDDDLRAQIQDETLSNEFHLCMLKNRKQLTRIKNCNIANGIYMVEVKEKIFLSWSDIRRDYDGKVI